MIIDNYELLYEEYKKFMNNKSQYNPKVVKYNTKSSTYFPVISFVLSNSTNSDDVTIDKIEQYDNYYFTNEIYTKDIIKNNKTIASQIVNDELTKLTIEFFEYYNMKRTLCQYTPNLDEDVLRRTLRHQCQIGNRGNIIRR